MKRNKKIVASVLAVLLAFVAVGGTIAWLTSQSQLTNSFTVGGINDPDNKPNPDDPDQPGDEELKPDGDDNGKLDGNLYESKWVDGSKLAPGASVDKNPNVGIGPESEDSFVFLFVDNQTVTADAATYAPYFSMGVNWAPVSGVAQASNNGTGNYVGGLFMYSGNGTDPSVLAGSDTTDAWTGEAFTQVTTPEATTKELFEDKPEITVYSYVYSAEGSTATEALEAAKVWAQDLAAQISQGN